MTEIHVLGLLVQAFPKPILSIAAAGGFQRTEWVQVQIQFNACFLHFESTRNCYGYPVCIKYWLCRNMCLWICSVGTTNWEVTYNVWTSTFFSWIYSAIALNIPIPPPKCNYICINVDIQLFSCKHSDFSAVENRVHSQGSTCRIRRGKNGNAACFCPLISIAISHLSFHQCPILIYHPPPPPQQPVIQERHKWNVKVRTDGSLVLISCTAFKLQQYFDRVLFDQFFSVVLMKCFIGYKLKWRKGNVNECWP